MHRRIYGVFRIIFVPAAAIVAADTNENANQDCVCRPSDLPIYTPDPTPISKVTKEPCPPEPGPIEAGFAFIRSSVLTVVNQAQAVRQMGEDFVTEGVDKAEGLVAYLQEEDNVSTKAGAIGIGGLSGLIMGLRGGLFRRTLFGSIGALGMAAICYPKEAAEYSEIGLVEGRKYMNIAYNFIYGVKKGDPPLQLPTLPKYPTSLSELWDTATSIGKSAASLVTGGIGEEEVAEEEVIGLGINIDPFGIVSDAHDLATKEDCHCPIGSCLGHHEEIFECVPSPDNQCPDVEPQEE